jgi:radical SAM superfamily enzyme YgiQ (UPF0313 family)
MLPLGLISIAAYARDRGYPVGLYDYGALNSLDQLLSAEHLSRIVAHDVIGLSIYNANALLAFSLACAIRRAHPHARIVAGGPHPTSCPEEVMRACCEIDYIVKGEGEIPFTQLLALAPDQNPSSIAGVVWRRGDLIIDNGRSVVVDDLDELPAPVVELAAAPADPLRFYDHVEGRVKRAVAMSTSRSCPYSCSFCAIILIGRKWRRASPAKVVSDFEALRAASGPYEHIYFMDANFFVDANRCVQLAEALSRLPEPPTFSFSTRVNQIVRAAGHVRRLTELGLRAVELGVESASPEALIRFAKDTTEQQNDAALDILDALGLRLILDFIMFDAECSLNDLQTNLEFIHRHGLDSYVPWDHLYSSMTPYLGTPIRKHYESLLGLRFPIHELPAAAPLLRDPLVARVYEEFTRVEKLVPRLTSAVRATQLRAMRLGSNDVEGARAMLNAVTLRRLPFVLLGNLVAAAQVGDSVEFERALPPFRADDGSIINLDELLDALVEA